MLDFLTKRPIAVLMSVLAISVLGLASLFTMPVSLLPDIDIPNIKVSLNYPNVDARNLENSIVRALRRELMQVNGVSDIQSITKDGSSEINMHFSHSINTDYAFIEVNEKIDASLNYFPKDLERPRVTKAKPSDIPVFYISITPKESFFDNNNTFKQLSEYTDLIIKKRLEQLDEVSLVDISGIDKEEILIEPKIDMLYSLGISTLDIENAISKSKFQSSSLSFRDGYYTYTLRIENPIKSIEDIKKISINKNGLLISLGEIADIHTSLNPGDGMFFQNGKRAISLAVYKQADARMQDIKKAIGEEVNRFRELRPNLVFDIGRDQTKLLDYSMNNLMQTLLLGILLAMVILWIFIKQARLTIIISLSIPVSLIISFFFLNLANISINIISLSGLILSVGLMIDNSIIVIDNINQYRLKGFNAFDSTVKGTNEVIRPLISSVLTTCAVFIPLIALSGIAGAIFYDQAITICISLGISLLVSIMVIPVLYYLLMKNTSISSEPHGFVGVYERLLTILMNKKILSLILFFMLIPIGIILFKYVEKQKFPDFHQKDIMIDIDWNEPISLDENNKRTLQFINQLNLNEKSYSSYIGKTQFLLSENPNQNTNTSTLYLNFDRIINTSELSSKILLEAKKYYPLANLKIYPSENIFQSVFNPNTEAVQAILRKENNQAINTDFAIKINSLIDKNHSSELNKIAINKLEYELYLLRDKCLLYNVEITSVVSKLKLLFGGNSINELQFGYKVVEIILLDKKSNPSELLSGISIKNKNNADIPLNSLVEYKLRRKLKSISADDKGEYCRISPLGETNTKAFENTMEKIFENEKDVQLTYSGSVYHSNELFNEFMKVISISLILLYLILAAQFESLLLPIIILLEILFDISGALFFLYIFNSSLNIMSALGIIVMAGIVINDSIIKIDTIKKSFASGLSIENAIFEGGKRRLYPIVMTSLTTVLALTPLLFFNGIGVELQLPLALSIMGGLIIGTIISLYFIPIMFYFLARKSKKFS